MKDKLIELLTELELRIEILEDDGVVYYLEELAKEKDGTELYYINEAIINLYSLEKELKQTYCRIGNIINEEGE